MLSYQSALMREERGAYIGKDKGICAYGQFWTTADDENIAVCIHFRFSALTVMKKLLSSKYRRVMTKFQFHNKEGMMLAEYIEVTSNRGEKSCSKYKIADSQTK
jgi:hypothetical protein